jgi:hypothetical protein
LLSNNHISQIKGPYKDLKEATELQLKREIMTLSILDLRENDIKSVLAIYDYARHFLRETVVLAWDNRFPQTKIDAYLS